MYPSAEPPSVINVTAEETSVNLSWVPGDRHRNFAFRFRYIQKSGESLIKV